MTRSLEFTLNGRTRTDAVADNVLLLDYLREIVGLTGTKTGCDGGECGACTVLVDDKPRLSCLTLATSIAGYIMASAGLLRRNRNPSDAEIREALGSNICRCTGYVKIIEAVKHAAALCADGLTP